MGYAPIAQESLFTLHAAAGNVLFAQGWEQIIFVLIFIAIIIFNVLGSLFSADKKKPKPEARGQAKQGEELRREIEEFRKARQQREMAAEKERPQPVHGRRVERSEPPRPEDRPRGPRKIGPDGRRPSPDGTEIRRRQESMKKDLQDTFSPKAVPTPRERGNAPVEAIPVERLVDDAVQEGVVEPPTKKHYAFDREREDSVAEDLYRLFQNPASMRQAILMSEILHRPTHRW